MAEQSTPQGWRKFNDANGIVRKVRVPDAGRLYTPAELTAFALAEADQKSGGAATDGIQNRLSLVKGMMDALVAALLAIVLVIIIIRLAIG